ncbi:hypothetical protein DY000_02028647 [Brassica cretica]|uniref:GRF-type domain-containing protein n=1 Tax=Brassica cretica TaxID=69181 RepID=A0ABQ7DH86_BRACR|nr:hypothetical protein DY000_02028647 [Brassica cretica]
MDSRNFPTQSSSYVGLLNSQQGSVLHENFPYESSQTSSTNVSDHEIRPEGVKAAKSKMNTAKEKSLAEYTSIWEMKKEDLAMKERLSKLAILDTLLAKKEPLSEAEKVKLKMGHDYSYSQPSESEDYGGNSVDSGYSETKDLIRRDQAKISYNARARIQYPPQPQVEFGFPQTCYCGAQPRIATSNSRNDPGRRYYTCAHVDDGECHVWKWWDVAVMEEMRARDRHVLQLAEKVDSLTLLTDYETEQKMVRLEKIVREKSRFSNGFEYFVSVMVIVLVLIGCVDCMVVPSVSIAKFVSQTSSTNVSDHEIRPEGVKAAKYKRNTAKEKSLAEYTSIWEMKKEDLAMKERMSKLAILDTLLAKKEPLSEAEEVKLKMGHDYSYSQPSESEDYGGNSVDSGYSETEDLIRRDQAEISYNARARVQYPPQPEVEFGFPQTCYCGAQPLLATSNSRNDPWRRYYTCAHVDDGECHVWKWWDVAVMEEMRARDRHVLQLAENVDSLTLLTDYETEQKMVRLEKIVREKSRFSNGFEYFVGVMVIVLVSIGVVLMFK